MKTEGNLQETCEKTRKCCTLPSCMKPAGILQEFCMKNKKILHFTILHETCRNPAGILHEKMT